MFFASQFTDNESERVTWNNQERSILTSGWTLQAHWRVSSQLPSKENLRSDQAEMELLYKAGAKRRSQPLMIIDSMIDRAQSLSDLCEQVGINWVVRIASDYDGSIGETGLKWGLIIEGERGSSLASLVYMRDEDDIAFWQTLPRLTRPQVIALSTALEEEVESR